MLFQRISQAAVRSSLLLLLAGAAPAFGDDFIAQFEGVAPGSNNREMVGVRLLPTGQAVMVAIPNEETRKKGEKPMPKKELADEVKRLSKDQYIRIGVAGSNMGPTLTSIEPYDLKPGEDTPNGYVFSKTFEKSNGKMTTTTVVLTRFGKEFTFGIPVKQGQHEQDPDVVAAIGKLQEGNSVWAQVVGNKILAIEPYTDPQLGKLVKLGDVEIDGRKVPSAEVETDSGKTVTLIVPVKPVGKSFAIDTLVNGQLHRLRPGAAVQYRTREDGDKIWLREISAAPKNAQPQMKADASTETPAKKKKP